MNRLPTVATWAFVEGVSATLTTTVGSSETEAYDLTDYAVLAQLRQYGSNVLIAEWTDASPEITFSPVEGQTILTIPGEQVDTFSFTKAIIDFYYKNSTTGNEIRSNPVEVVWYDGVSVP